MRRICDVNNQIPEEPLVFYSESLFWSAAHRQCRYEYLNRKSSIFVSS
jgi:hypothetical protein